MEESLHLVVHIRKENGKMLVKQNELDSLVNRRGVWAMWSKEASDKNAVLLEVGQSADIVYEIEKDVKLIILQCKSNDIYRDMEYAARRMFPGHFSKTFAVLPTDKDRTAAKYRVVSKRYNDIYIYALLDEMSHSEIKTERELVEYKYAVDNQAIFWNAWGKQRKLANEYLRLKQEK